MSVVRRRTSTVRGFDIGLMVVGIATVVLGVSVGLEAARSASGRIDGLPPAPAFMFAMVAALAVAGDFKLMRSDMRRKPIVRHSWRMCFALFSAAGSFFPAQLPKLIPALRGSPLLIVPVVGLLIAMFYWMVRVRIVPRYRDWDLPRG